MIGLFIDPTPALELLVRERKASAATRWPDATYLSHPIHATLVAGAFAEPEEWTSALTTRLATVPAFAIACCSSSVFADDPATGGSTVVIDIVPSDELSALQLVVAQTIAPYRDRATAESLAFQYQDSRASHSMRAFGSPWIGAHWRPHFTIGSFATGADAPELRALLAPFSPVSVPVHAVSVWRITGDQHEPLATIALDGAPRA